LVLDGPVLLDADVEGHALMSVRPQLDAAWTGLQPHPSILKITDSTLIETVDEDLR
jgi:hypothetical protein